MSETNDPQDVDADEMDASGRKNDDASPASGDVTNPSRTGETFLPGWSGDQAVGVEPGANSNGDDAERGEDVQ